jgi:predicted transcriptional regulator
VASRTEQARELALRLVRERPGVQQRDLVAAVQEQTDLASSTITRMLQVLERDGDIEGRLDGRRKAYAPAGAAQEERRPEATSTSPGSRGELVAVVTAVFIAASLVAFVLAPDKNDDSSSSAAAPVAEPAPAPPAKPRKKTRKPKPRPRRSTGALAAAKRTNVAVLSGSAVPGIAGKTGAALKRRGFRVGTVGNAPGPSDHSVVLYTRGKRGAARALGASIKIRATKAADPASTSTAPGAGLIVIVGADRRR